MARARTLVNATLTMTTVTKATLADDDDDGDDADDEINDGPSMTMKH